MGNDRMFRRYIGVDYSGARTPKSRLDGLAVRCALGDREPVRVPAVTDVPNAVNWTRKELACWLVERLKGSVTTIVGIDHGFSFPTQYFRHYRKETWPDWDRFLNDFQQVWRTDCDCVRVETRYYEQIELMMKGRATGCRFGRGDWKRLTEPDKAKSVFDFMDQAPVAHSTHAGIPWLRYIREQLRKANAKVHFWPFDGWNVEDGYSVVAEVYPALWSELYPNLHGARDRHDLDAYRVARWMSEKDRALLLRSFFRPRLNGLGYAQAAREGWILGVVEPPDLDPRYTPRWRAVRPAKPEFTEGM